MEIVGERHLVVINTWTLCTFSKGLTLVLGVVEDGTFGEAHEFPGLFLLPENPWLSEANRQGK